MEKNHRGLSIARDIILMVTFCLTLANLIIMIIQLASSVKHARGFVRIKDSDELPF